MSFFLQKTISFSLASMKCRSLAVSRYSFPSWTIQLCVGLYIPLSRRRTELFSTSGKTAEKFVV